MNIACCNALILMVILAAAAQFIYHVVTGKKLFKSYESDDDQIFPFPYD